jgi:hypothetical protein
LGFEELEIAADFGVGDGGEGVDRAGASDGAEVGLAERFGGGEFFDHAAGLG